jgi:serine protease
MSTSHAIDGRSPTGAAGPAQAVRLTLALVVALLAGLTVAGVFSSTLSGFFGSSGIPVTAAVSNPYAPDQLVIGSTLPEAELVAYVRAHTGIRLRASGESSDAPGEQILRLPTGTSVTTAAATVRSLPSVSYAVPNYIASVSGNWVPNDPGTSGKAGGWQKLQWNFTPAEGVDAPEAWANLIGDHRPGARGLVIAVVDSGVAFRNWEAFKRSPDFAGTKFVSPCDLVVGTIRAGSCTDPYALDRLGHGTFVAGTIAEATNNGIGVTGLAYNASIMPVRVLDAGGAGTGSTIAEGVRYAVQHGAQVINLSLEFPPGTTAGQIPELISAIAYAHARGVVVAAAAGNDYGTTLDYPAADPDVISVGATTIDRCLAAYSDTGRTLDLVAPGGGDDSATVHTANCHPLRNLADIYQMTFPNQPSVATSAKVDAFTLQGGWYGTSMATPDVSAAAAMVIASGVLGPRPTPGAILQRLEATTRHLSGAIPNSSYGYGLLDIGAATAKGGPLTPTTPITTTTTPTTPTTTTCTTTTTTPSTTGTTTTGTTTTTTTSTTTTTNTTTTQTTTVGCTPPPTATGVAATKPG